MKKIVAISVFLTFCFIAKSQSNYNQQLEKAAAEISGKIITAKKTNIAVLDFENSNKQVSELGSWLASVFTTHLENKSNNLFSVKNKGDLEKALQQIKSESGSGAFDSKTIQRLGEISGSDVIIYGEITLMDNEVTVNIRTKNISLTGTIGGTLVSFTATEGMISKYDNYLEEKNKTNSNISSSSGASGEGTSRTSKNPNCKEKNTGDYCFQNNTKVNLNVSFHPTPPVNSNNIYAYNSPSDCTLQPGQKQCFFDVGAGPATYTIKEISPNPYSTSPYRANGTLYVEVCQEKVFIIK